MRILANSSLALKTKDNRETQKQTSKWIPAFHKEIQTVSH